MNATAQLCDQELPINPDLLMLGLDVIPDGIAVVENGRILYANRAFGSVNRSRTAELRGQLLQDFLPKDTYYVDSSHIEALGDGQEQLEASVFEFYENHRRLHCATVRAIKFRESPGIRLLHFHSEDEPSRLPGIAHDFGNVLTGILLYSDLLIAELAENTLPRRHADAIRRAGIDGARLIQQLLQPAPNDVTESQPSSFSLVASEMASLLTRIVGSGIEIETRFSSVGLVNMDAGQANQIILNLVINARDAMPMGGRITLSSRPGMFRFDGTDMSGPVPVVEFSVTDSGTGMDKKTQGNVFRPFFTTKPRSKGNGLGLTMVRSMVRQAGGEVEIESELGKGTRVTIRMLESTIRMRHKAFCMRFLRWNQKVEHYE